MTRVTISNDNKRARERTREFYRTFTGQLLLLDTNNIRNLETQTRNPKPQTLNLRLEKPNVTHNCPWGHQAYEVPKCNWLYTEQQLWRLLWQSHISNTVNACTHPIVHNYNDYDRVLCHCTSLHFAASRAHTHQRINIDNHQQQPLLRKCLLAAATTRVTKCNIVEFSLNPKPQTPTPKPQTCSKMRQQTSGCIWWRWGPEWETWLHAENIRENGCVSGFVKIGHLTQQSIVF